jgi:hypothetical protein
MIDINEVRWLAENGVLQWTLHIHEKMESRGITREEVEHSLLSAELVIEQYPDDRPHASCLVMGIAPNGEKLHVVCAPNENELWLITCYYPDLIRWESDFVSRKGSRL